MVSIKQIFSIEKSLFENIGTCLDIASDAVKT